MSQRNTQSDVRPLTCRRCEYTTDVLRPSCPECGGDMIYAE